MSPPALSLIESGADIAGSDREPQSTERVERFRTIYESTHPAIQSYCRRRTDAASAEDAVSEVYLTAWRRLDDVDGPLCGSPKLWLFGVARRVLANQRRSSARQDNLHLRLVSDSAVNGPDLATETDTDQPVLVALATLSDSDQEILRLTTWEELTLDEAGEVLGCTANAAGIRAHRARTRLAEALDKNHPTTPSTESDAR